MHFCVVLGHAKRTGVNAVATIEAARLQCREHHTLVSCLNRVCRTNKCTGGLDTVHADRGHCRCGLRAIEIVDIDHRIALVRTTLATCGTARAAAYTALRIDEHCFFHDGL